LDWNPLIIRELASRFIVGLAPNQWTFSRFMSGPTSAPAALRPGTRLVDFPGFGGCSPPMNREASPQMKRENPTPVSHFSGLSTDEARMTLRA
jgi:hypothetical protein